uniref:Ion_trans_2 domain-containing protein n=1 Tax=Rhabditophanes sp. KR3021 TaxID=114890 RepID=A0AC35U888_9BILA
MAKFNNAASFDVSFDKVSVESLLSDNLSLNSKGSCPEELTFQEPKRNIFAKAWSFLKLILDKSKLLIIIIIYSIIGALIFMYMETPSDLEGKKEAYQFHLVARDNLLFNLQRIHGDGKEDRDFRWKEAILEFEASLNINIPELETVWTFWMAILYAGTVYTTIGYGNISTATVAGKLFTMAYGLFGIPLFILILNNLSEFMIKKIRIYSVMIEDNFFYFAVKIKILKLNNEARTVRYKKIRGHKFKNNIKFIEMDKLADVDVESNIQTDDQTINITKVERPEMIEPPVFTVLIMTFGWFFISAAMFCLWEEEWSYFTSFWFIFVSLSTIGFGDVSPNHPEYMCAAFGAVIVGLSMVSVCINVMQDKIEIWYMTILNKMLDEYMEAQLNGDPSAAKGVMSKFGGRAKYLMPLITKNQGAKMMEQLKTEAKNKGIELPPAMTSIDPETGRPNFVNTKEENMDKFIEEKKVEAEQKAASIEKSIEHSLLSLRSSSIKHTPSPKLHPTKILLKSFETQTEEMLLEGLLHKFNKKCIDFGIESQAPTSDAMSQSINVVKCDIDIQTDNVPEKKIAGKSVEVMESCVQTETGFKKMEDRGVQPDVSYLAKGGNILRPSSFLQKNVVVEEEVLRNKQNSEMIKDEVDVLSPSEGIIFNYMEDRGCDPIHLSNLENMGCDPISLNNLEDRGCDPIHLSNLENIGCDPINLNNLENKGCDPIVIKNQKNTIIQTDDKVLKTKKMQTRLTLFNGAIKKDETIRDANGMNIEEKKHLREVLTEIRKAVSAKISNEKDDFQVPLSHEEECILLVNELEHYRTKIGSWPKNRNIRKQVAEFHLSPGHDKVTVDYIPDMHRDSSDSSLSAPFTQLFDNDQQSTSKRFATEIDALHSQKTLSGQKAFSDGIKEGDGLSELRSEGVTFNLGNESDTVHKESILKRVPSGNGKFEEVTVNIAFVKGAKKASEMITTNEKDAILQMVAQDKDSIISEEEYESSSSFLARHRDQFSSDEDDDNLSIEALLVQQATQTDCLLNERGKCEDGACQTDDSHLTNILVQTEFPKAVDSEVQTNFKESIDMTIQTERCTYQESQQQTDKLILKTLQVQTEIADISNCESQTFIEMKDAEVQEHLDFEPKKVFNDASPQTHIETMNVDCQYQFKPETADSQLQVGCKKKEEAVQTTIKHYLEKEVQYGPSIGERETQVGFDGAKIVKSSSAQSLTLLATEFNSKLMRSHVTSQTDMTFEDLNTLYLSEGSYVAKTYKKIESVVSSVQTDSYQTEKRPANEQRDDMVDVGCQAGVLARVQHMYGGLKRVPSMSSESIEGEQPPEFSKINLKKLYGLDLSKNYKPPESSPPNSPLKQQDRLEKLSNPEFIHGRGAKGMSEKERGHMTAYHGRHWEDHGSIKDRKKLFDSAESPESSSSTLQRVVRRTSSGSSTSSQYYPRRKLDHTKEESKDESGNDL